MEFLYPNMLYALFALIIPIIIHLFNFRRHKLVYFSNTAFLKTIEQENSKTKKLKYFVILMMRMVFIAALVVAFAFPYKKNDNLVNNNVDNLIAVYIDNSMSMQSYSEEKTLFEDSRTSAMQLVENLNQAQKYILLSNDRDPKNEYPMNKDEMLMCLNEMKTETVPITFEDIYNSLSFIKKKNDFKSATLFAYSDFQENMMNFNDLKVDSSIQVVIIPLKSEFQNNIYIDSAWLQSPVLQKDITNELNARIVNETSNDVKGLPVNLSLDENVVAYTTCDINANSFTDVNMQFVVDNEGDIKAKVGITDSPINFDDEYNMVLKVRPSINVIEIKSSAVNAQQTTVNSLELLFDGDALINYQSIDMYGIDYDVINNAQMIVVNENASLNETMQQTLLDFANHGGTLLVFAGIPDSSDSGYQDYVGQLYNSYFYNQLGISPIAIDENETRVEYIAQRNSFFDDIFVKLPDNAELPEINKHIRFVLGKNALNIISLQNGDPLLMMSNYGKGKVFLMSSSLNEDYSDLANHALFVPIMYKMALISGNVTDMSYTLGRDKVLNINDIILGADDKLSLRINGVDTRSADENNSNKMFPLVEKRNNQNFIYFFEDLPSAGFYDIYRNEEYIRTIAWNDDRDESRMSFCDKDELNELLSDNNINVVAMIGHIETHDHDSDDMLDFVVQDSSLWRIFVVIALISLLVEILILRFWK